MAFVTVFKRYELKYMLTLEQKEKILQAMANYMKLDKYGRTTMWICRENPCPVNTQISRERIYKTSFSKYGTAYSTLIFPELYLPNTT